MSNATKLWISEKRLTHKINNILGIIFRLNANVILSLLMCKSDIPVPFFTAVLMKKEERLMNPKQKESWLKQELQG